MKSVVYPSSSKEGNLWVGILLLVLCLPPLLLVILVYAFWNGKDRFIDWWFRTVLRKNPPIPCDPHGRPGWMGWKAASLKAQHVHHALDIHPEVCLSASSRRCVPARVLATQRIDEFAAGPLSGVSTRGLRAKTFFCRGGTQKVKSEEMVEKQAGHRTHLSWNSSRMR